MPNQSYDAAPSVYTGPSVREAAIAWHRAGFTVLPVRGDGSKRPDVDSWTCYQHEQPTPARMRAWFDSPDRCGLGVVCGAISGGLEMLELEGRAIHEGARDRVLTAVDRTGLKDVWRTLVRGYTEFSPSGGLHLLYRLSDHDVPGNTKVARRPKTTAELDDRERALVAKHPGKVFPLVLAETRGEGGFVVVAPSHGTVHASGQPWRYGVGAQPGVVPTIPWEQRCAVISAIGEALDTMPAPVVTQIPATSTRSYDGDRPGDAYARTTSWADILSPHGWTVDHVRGDMTYWRRPGSDKTFGWSARTGGTHDGLYVWSTSTEFPTEQNISKFQAYAILCHAGDYRAAAIELKRAGYGTERVAA